MMLGTLLRRDRNQCKYRCCDRRKAPRILRTSNVRAQDKRSWRRQEDPPRR